MPGTFGFQKSLEVLSNKVFRFIQQTLPKATTGSDMTSGQGFYKTWPPTAAGQQATMAMPVVHRQRAQ